MHRKSQMTTYAGMESLVESVLQDAAEKDSRLKTTEVQKDIDLEYDEGNLLAVDPNPLIMKQIRSSREVYLKSLARDNAQLLINQIWELPVERVEGTITVKLPAPKTILPREKPIPQDNPLTKWQKYAQLKGIQNKKKGRMVFDEESREYKPRWGYKRANDETKPWVIEVPANANPYEDQYAKRLKAKKERVAKNELQRLRNIARSSGKSKVPGVGLTPTENPDKDHLSRALTMAKKSTASVGKFTQDLAKEKKHSKSLGKKRKFESNVGDLQTEKRRALELLGSLHNRTPTLNVDKAINQHMNQDDQERAATNKKNPSFKIKGKGKGKPGGKKGFGEGGKKGFGGGGKKGKKGFGDSGKKGFGGGGKKGGGGGGGGKRGKSGGGKSTGRRK